jgi:hypothetical protein
MPLYRFIGTHTNGRTAITICGVTFTGIEPAQVEGEALRRLANHPEFEAVEPVEVPAKPKRGRPRKAD